MNEEQRWELEIKANNVWAEIEELDNCYLEQQGKEELVSAERRIKELEGLILALYGILNKAKSREVAPNSFEAHL